jgi:Ca2+-binding EF-hand superfamily protein
MSTVDNIRAAYDAVLESLTCQAFALRAPSFDKLREAFTTVDWNGEGVCDKSDFGDVLNYCGLFLKTQEVTSIYKQLDAKNSGVINVQSFINDLCPPLNARRANITNIAWKSVAPDGGFVDVDAICQSYNAAGHPDVLVGSTGADIVAQRFAEAMPMAGVDVQAFTDYWRSISAVCPRDNYFVSMVESLFTVKENQDVVDKPRLLLLINVLRNKVIQKKKGGESQKVTILRNLKFQDADDADKLSPAEFAEAMRCFGIPLKAADVEGFFFLYGNETGNMSIKHFVSSFMGETKDCESVVRDA